MPKYNKHHTENTIFALIITIAPTPTLCEEIVNTQTSQEYTQIAQKIHETPNNKQKYHGPKHNPQIFKKLNETLFTTPISTYKEIHEEITKNKNNNIQKLQNKYPRVPITLLEKNARMPKTNTQI
jgi:hypothetical protein